MNDKNDSVPESENNPIGFTEEDRAKLKDEFGKLGKTVGEATGMMFEGFAAMLEGFQAVLGEMKFHNFSDLIGSAVGPGSQYWKSACGSSDCSFEHLA